MDNKLPQKLKVFCPDCGAEEWLSPQRFCCDCGGAWEIPVPESFDPALITRVNHSIWRYKELLTLGIDHPSVDLGVGMTPLISSEIHGHTVHLKPEYFNPTGSFKDRGVSVMINYLAALGVTDIAEDSSGNAGASVAAHAACAGMQANIYVPAYASPSKLAQIRVYGANLHPVEGPRVNAKQAAIAAVKNEGLVFASHAYQPVYLLGQQTIGWEVWEQLGEKVPDWIIVPVGQGGLLLGFWLAFERLRMAGLTNKTPRLAAVQPENLAPLCRAFSLGADIVQEVSATQPSVAEGLAIANPVRGRRLLQALRESGGTCITVSESAILDAQQELALRGLYVEPTSATVIAALKNIEHLVQKDDVIVIPLTGSGLKGSPKL